MCTKITAFTVPIVILQWLIATLATAHDPAPQYAGYSMVINQTIDKANNKSKIKFEYTVNDLSCKGNHVLKATLYTAVLNMKGECVYKFNNPSGSFKFPVPGNPNVGFSINGNENIEKPLPPGVYQAVMMVCGEIDNESPELLGCESIRFDIK